MSEVLTEKQISDAIKEKNNVEREIFKALLLGRKIWEDYIDTVYRYNGKLYYIRKWIEKKLISVNIFENENDKYTYTSMISNLLYDTVIISYYKNDYIHALFKPADMKFKDGFPVRVDYYIKGLKYTQEKYSKMMEEDLAKALGGESSEEVKTKMQRQSGNLVNKVGSRVPEGHEQNIPVGR